MWIKRQLGAGSVLAFFDHTNISDRKKNLRQLKVTWITENDTTFREYIDSLM